MLLGRFLSALGPVFKRSRLAGAATYCTKYSIRAIKFHLEVMKSLN